MFKSPSVTDELMSVMEKNLVKNASAGMHHERLSKAVDLLDYAARLLEDAGLPETSTKIVDILADVAGKIATPSEEEMNANDQE